MYQSIIFLCGYKNAQENRAQTQDRCENRAQTQDGPQQTRTNNQAENIFEQDPKYDGEIRERKETFTPKTKVNTCPKKTQDNFTVQIKQ